MTVHLDAAKLKELKAVNAEVNALTYETDLAQWGRGEFWERIGLTGKEDCEGFALEKQKRLRDLGWPETSLRLATCTYKGAGHAVLTVDTDQGTLVLDNRYPEPQPWQLLPYDWIERQAATGPGWVSIAKTDGSPQVRGTSALASGAEIP